MLTPDRSNVTLGTVLSFTLLLAQAPVALAQNEHTLPLFVSASHQTLQGFARIINLSDRDGEVTIRAIDDAGNRFGPVTLSLEAKATRHFSSDDLRDGNADKGLSGGIGSGEGSNWRLELETDLDIDPLVYTRPRGEGFVTSTYDIVAEGESMRWRVSFFNPGSNTVQRSWLRVINTSGVDTEVTVEGLDDNGADGAEVVQFDLAADAARMLSAQELEEGSSDSTFDGRLGDGHGKWQLFVSADQPIQVMSLLISESGYLTNLSTSTIGAAAAPADFAPVDQADFDARFVGKRVIFHDEPGYYWDIVSPGHFHHFEESRGTYVYQKTGTNAGVLELLFGVDERCLIQITFDSTTTGAMAFACKADNYEQETPGVWELAEVPGTGFAPEDQAAFDARFVGKRLLVYGEGHADLVSPGRFLFSDDDGSPVNAPGSYTYERTGQNTGALNIRFDVGCTGRWELTFVSASSGNYTGHCDDEEGEGSWEVEEIPATGFAPEDQAAFNTRFIGERWIFTSDPNLEEPFEIVWHFISSGRYEDHEDGEYNEGGTYAYQNTGLNTGIIRFRPFESEGLGDLETLNVTFESATGGTFSIVLDGSLLTGSWRVAGGGRT